MIDALRDAIEQDDEVEAGFARRVDELLERELRPRRPSAASSWDQPSGRTRVLPMKRPAAKQARG